MTAQEIRVFNARLLWRLRIYRELVWVRWCALSRRFGDVYHRLSGAAYDRLKARERKLLEQRQELDHWVQRLTEERRELLRKADLDTLNRILAERCSPP